MEQQIFRTIQNWTRSTPRQPTKPSPLLDCNGSNTSTTIPTRGITQGATTYKSLLFADDIASIANTRQDLQIVITSIATTTARFNQHPNFRKYKILQVSRKDIILNPIQIHTHNIEHNIEQVNKFKYLGRIINSTNNDTEEIKCRIRNAWATYHHLKKILKSSIPTDLKRKYIKVCIQSALSYGCPTWVIKKQDETTLKGFESRLYRAILGMRKYDHTTNITVRNRLNITETMFQHIQLAKLQFIGKICQSQNMFQLFSSAPPEAPPVKGRPPMEYLENLINWTDLTLEDAIIYSAEEQEWKKIVMERIAPAAEDAPEWAWNLPFIDVFIFL